jgi:hypothetical protein
VKRSRSERVARNVARELIYRFSFSDFDDYSVEVNGRRVGVVVLLESTSDREKRVFGGADRRRAYQVRRMVDSAFDDASEDRERETGEALWLAASIFQVLLDGAAKVARGETP